MTKRRGVVVLLVVLGASLAHAQSASICATGEVREFKSLPLAAKKWGKFAAAFDTPVSARVGERNGFVYIVSPEGYGNGIWTQEYLDAEAKNKEMLLQLAFAMRAPVVVSSIGGHCDVEPAPALEIIICNNPSSCPIAKFKPN